MDKLQSFLKVFLGLLFLVLCGTSIALGFYGYRKFGSQRAVMSAKDQQIEKLSQAQSELKREVAQAEERRTALEEENERLKKEAETTEGQKKLILNQVRTSVDSFESFRTQATEEITRLRASTAAFDAEKKALSEKLAAAENMTKADKEKMETQVGELSRQIENHKETEARLRSNVRKKDKVAIVTETAKLHYNQGNYYFRGRNFLQAAAEYQKAVFYQPNDADAQYNLAVVLDEALGDYPAALEHYKRYLELRPDAKDELKIRERVMDLELKQKLILEPAKAFDARGAIGRDRSSDLAKFEMAGDKK